MSSEWLLPDRYGFNEFLERRFQVALANELDRNDTLYAQQRIVRNFLQADSPYRGLLLYHGLGVGKTRAAISSALQVLSAGGGKRALVMLPASLRQNFVNELNQMTDDPSLFGFVNYNGLSRSKVRALCRDPRVFDDTVVIIDEVHNFISSIKDTGGVLRLVYDTLVESAGSKIIAMSGTPLINEPTELCYIANLVHGPIEVTEIDIAKVQDLQRIETVLRGHPYVASFYSWLKVNTLTLRLTPAGFRRNPETDMVYRDPDPPENPAKAVADSLGTLCVVKKIRAWRGQLLPTAPEDFQRMYLDPNDPLKLVNTASLAKRLTGVVSFFSSYDPKLFPMITSRKLVHLPMSAHQFNQYTLKRMEERAREERSRRMSSYYEKKGKASPTSSGSYRPYSRELCNFVFPPGHERPYQSYGKQEPSSAYLLKLRRAVQAIPEDALRLDKLHELSPKFKKIVQHLLSPASHSKTAVVYSQFRNAEGIELLAAAMRANGFQQIKDTRDWSPGETDVPRFIVYDNSDPDEMQNLLHLFNSELERIPADKLPGSVDVDRHDNKRGDIAKVLMITKSGAEGITLKNVREVHVLEPYWHLNRIEQAIGRAVRAKSHLALPAQDRIVSVFMYIATFTKEQLGQDQAIRTKDKGLTSDQYVHAVALEKRKLLDQVSRVMRLASIDCRTHAVAHGTPREKCFDPQVKKNSSSDVVTYMLDYEHGALYNS